MMENREFSAVDDLTRVASRRFFVKQFPRELKRAARHGRPLSLILCDIDHFRIFHEALGHPGGDEVLRQFGERVQEGLRPGIDWVARIGGEEFAIVMPERDYQEGLNDAVTFATPYLATPLLPKAKGPRHREFRPLRNRRGAGGRSQVGAADDANRGRGSISQ